MQHAMVANRNANASRGKPQDKMVATQRDSDVMTLFRDSREAVSLLTWWRCTWVLEYSCVIEFDAGQPRQACTANPLNRGPIKIGVWQF
jgi:hypothetical protein